MLGMGMAQSAKTHCKRGHELDEVNTYVTPKGYRNCRKCRVIAQREFLQRHPGYEQRYRDRQKAWFKTTKTLDRFLWANYKIRAADFHALLEKQDGKCAICREECNSGRRLQVDHDHATGSIRGLLCLRCNVALGGFRDRPELLERAASYLRSELGH